MKRKKIWKRDKNNFYYQYVCPNKDNAAHACFNKSISSEKLKKMIFDKFIREIETAKENRKRALQYETTLKYRMWHDFRKARIAELEDLHIDANVALKFAYEKYQDNLYTQDDFKKIHQHLHQRKNNLKAEMLEVQAELDEYRKYHSSESDKIRALMPFDGANELSKDMCKIIDNCELNERIMKIRFLY